MAQVPYTFVNGTLADADQVNADFDALEAAVGSTEVPTGSIVPTRAWKPRPAGCSATAPRATARLDAALFAVIGTRY